MKLRINTSMFQKKRLFKFLNRNKEMERKIDILAGIVNKNKLVAPATVSIDEVVRVAKQKKICYRVYM